MESLFSQVIIEMQMSVCALYLLWPSFCSYAVTFVMNHFQVSAFLSIGMAYQCSVPIGETIKKHLVPVDML
jgi:hypothetical protein